MIFRAMPQKHIFQLIFDSLRAFPVKIRRKTFLFGLIFCSHTCYFGGQFKEENFLDFPIPLFNEVLIGILLSFSGVVTVQLRQEVWGSRQESDGRNAVCAGIQPDPIVGIIGLRIAKENTDILSHVHGSLENHSVAPFLTDLFRESYFQKEISMLGSQEQELY